MTTVGTLQEGHDQAQQPRPGQVCGRVALVTGGTRGIGAAVCRELADQGAHIAAGYWVGDEDVEKFMAGMTADFAGRLITVHEGNIARVVCFLAADASSYVTGQIWAVNGGLDM